MAKEKRIIGTQVVKHAGKVTVTIIKRLVKKTDKKE
jgi:hypothetical protein